MCVIENFDTISKWVQNLELWVHFSTSVCTYFSSANWNLLVFLEYNIDSPDATFNINVILLVSATVEIGYILFINGNASKTFFNIYFVVIFATNQR